MSRPEQVRRSASKAAAGGRRNFFIACLVIALAAIASGLWREANNPRFEVQVGQMSGLVHESQDEVLAAAALAPKQNAWLIDRRAVERRVESLPWVSRASVTVSWPNVVSIDVVERSPVARVELVAADLAGTPPAFAVIDEACQVLAVTTDPGEWASLPALVVSPPLDGSAQPGQRLDAGGVPQALDALHELRGLGLAVSAVSVAPATGIGATADRNLRVLFGDDDDLARKVSLFLAIAAKISTPERIAYVDVRSIRAPTVLYR